MKYKFSTFILDSNSKEISVAGNIVKFSQQHYEMLLFLVKNPSSVFSKDELIESVWQGRHVTNNSVDQCISKLRKKLDDLEAGSYIETVYGRGLKFVPSVVAIKDAPEQGQKTVRSGYRLSHIITMALALVVLAVIVDLLWVRDDQLVTNQQSQLLLLNDNTTTTDTWPVAPYLGRIFNYANAAQVKLPEDQLNEQERQQYLERQWRLSPDLKVVTSRLETITNGYSITLTISSRAQPDLSHTFSGTAISPLMKEVSHWLAKQIDQSKRINQIQSLLPNDSFLLELYMRGISASKKGAINEAEHLFKLCLESNQSFHLARLELADVKSKQGKPQEALALLDTLSSLAVFPHIEIEIETIRGDILDTQGKHEEAKDLYLATINKYKNDPQVNLDGMRYNLSHIYASLQEYDLALAELDQIKADLSEAKNPELLAHVYQKTGSIQQGLGHTKLATENANAALDLFSRLEELPGKAKTLSLLGRISNHQSLYNQAAQYLQQALQINKSMNYRLGEGAVLNELVYIYMVQGKFSLAIELNKKMQVIALEIDYANMLLAAKEHAVNIARAQKNWTTSRLFLDEHLQLAISIKNNRGVLKNKLMSLDFYLDQKQHEPVLPIIEAVQEHINQSKELRLEPRLKRQLARYYLLIDKESEALDLLQTAGKMAIETDDGETLSEIGNLLAQYYLDSQQSDKALSTLLEVEKHNPLPYPYLLLKAKALMLSGQPVHALATANLCKQNANEWWSREDEQYLAKLMLL